MYPPIFLLIVEIGLLFLCPTLKIIDGVFAFYTSARKILSGFLQGVVAASARVGLSVSAEVYRRSDFRLSVRRAESDVNIYLLSVHDDVI